MKNINVEANKKALHVICHRDVQGKLQGMSRVDNNIYQLNSWAFRQEPSDLIGGWIYLHAEKSRKSEFGGIVRDVRPAERVGKSITQGYAFVIESHEKGRDQRWRGKKHARAWTGDIIDANLPHEE